MKNPYINDFAEKWLQALESGKYAQGQDYLCNGDKFCCLGVAEDLAGTPYTTHGALRCYADILPNKYLTEKTKNTLNLKSILGASKAPFSINRRRFGALVEANDAGCSFKEIAAAIRKNPELFFNEPEIEALPGIDYA